MELTSTLLATAALTLQPYLLSCSTVQLFSYPPKGGLGKGGLQGGKVFLVSWPRRADLSFLQGSPNSLFANRVVGGRRESKVIPF